MKTQISILFPGDPLFYEVNINIENGDDVGNLSRMLKMNGDICERELN